MYIYILQSSSVYFYVCLFLLLKIQFFISQPFRKHSTAPNYRSINRYSKTISNYITVIIMIKL